MPELPEVEVVRRQIEPLLVGRTIQTVALTPDPNLFLTRPSLLRRRLTRRVVERLIRHGKYLIAHLDDESRLLVHLGMTGQLFASSASSPRLLLARDRVAAGKPNRLARSGTFPPERLTGAGPLTRRFEPDRHTHLRLSFADGGPEVFFRDVRKFGKLQHLRPGDESPRLAKLGPDALTIDTATLHRAASRRRASIKLVLLDQTVLAGVGNIYADEALFRAKIRPTRPAELLSPRGTTAIVVALQSLFASAIAAGGTSINDFIHPDGEDGGFSSELRVYGRGGSTCLVCRTEILRTVLGGRSTHYCPRCQPR